MRAFREVMITGTVSQAARNLHRTQPAVSALITSLENDLGMNLFDRRHGRLIPVPEARYLFEECDELLGRLGRINQNMRQMRSLESGELKIASSLGPSMFVVPNINSEIGLSHPEVKITLISRSSDAVYQLIAGQRYDLGIADFDPLEVDESGLFEIRKFKFDCLCAIPEKHELIGCDVVTPADLENCRLAMLNPEHQSYRRTAKLFSEPDHSLDVRFTTQHFIPLLTYVENNLACAIVDPIAAQSYQLYRGHSSTITFKRIEPCILFELAVIRPSHRPLSIIAQHFEEKLLNELSRIAMHWA